MDTIGKPVVAPVRSHAFTGISLALHLVVLVFILHHSRHFIAPIRYPGTEHGHNIMLSYLPGRAQAPAVAPAPKAPPLDPKSQLHLPKPEQPQPKPETASPNRNSPASDHPDSSSGADALGSGNINIAMAKYFPRPKPSLANMPRGAKGDVILEVIIDETGKISDLKLVQGIEPTINETVIATVRQWTFDPASRDGQPIASERELHFHYEKG